MCPSVPSDATMNSVSRLPELTRPFVQLDTACTLNAIGHPGTHARAISAYSTPLISAYGGVQVDRLSLWLNF